MNQCDQPPLKMPRVIDVLILPQLFYQAVLARNEKEIVQIIKHHPYLSVQILSLYDIQLKNSFYYKKEGKSGAPLKIQWKLENVERLVLNYNEQAEFYKYVTEARPERTNFGFLLFCLNNYMTQLDTSLKIIHAGGIPVRYFKLGVNVHTNLQMERFIKRFLYRNQ